MENSASNIGHSKVLGTRIPRRSRTASEPDRLCDTCADDMGRASCRPCRTTGRAGIRSALATTTRVISIRGTSRVFYALPPANLSRRYVVCTLEGQQSVAGFDKSAVQPCLAVITAVQCLHIAVIEAWMLQKKKRAAGFASCDVMPKMNASGCSMLPCRLLKVS